MDTKSIDSTSISIFTPYQEIADKYLRTMSITTDARFTAARRLKHINDICFITTTIASLGLILIPLLDLAGINKSFSSITLTIIQVFLAVCVLVYSTAIATANFQVRSKEFLQCGDRIKKIIDEFKVHLVDVKHKNEKPNLEKYMNEYRKVLDGFENHDDVDYKSAFYEYENKRYIALSEDDKSKCVKPKKPKKFWIYIPSCLIVILEVLIISSMLISYFCYEDKVNKNLPMKVKTAVELTNSN
ncbi:SLATT domain-containing protein [Acinetobacter baumannii]|nr:SLATT domain-containing protein [Acinetobacter baumannii]EKU4538207.1 SLATT domain-containing protein [Acinetobacter baumannii]EKX0727276.1 SLATT domain-containing protein [Acinetobacter baumannii]ELA8288890.1 SLATT domain-containing protein [Acinetobacter baumannii]ELN5400437.1 SLATT domain-containing protein [Acinetobacter baumannii]